jgi:hypothetical protein
VDRFIEIFFLPPVATARVGGSDHPLEAFEWATDVSIHGAHQTVIKPAVTLEVSADGSLRPYLPNSIRFRDGDQLRPAAPFFELWARLQSSEDGAVRSERLTPGLLRQHGAATENLRYVVTMGNRKAQRRTQSPACAFVARIEVSGADHERKPLMASSPHSAGQEPLVSVDHPIPLGHFQVTRPTEATALGIELAQLRVRFTPARGQVYGPPSAIAGPSSPVQPGQIVAAAVLPGVVHEIVPPENRILNPNTPWSTYVMNATGQTDPQPCDSYDGADVGNWQSWGVVDDTCDGIIEAQLIVGAERFTATARVLSGVPDYAPDRRPFVSFAGDLADRELPPLTVDRDTLSDARAEIADLFMRVFETSSLLNLDATRYKGIESNINDPPPPNYPGLPQIDERTMTREDEPFVDLTPALINSPAIRQESVGGPYEPLPYSAVARAAHAPLTDVDSLIDFLRTHKEHVQRLIRPPYGRFAQFAEAPDVVPNSRFRDPRVSRDGLHDMRMPPYMRDSDENSLSLSWRDHDELMKLLELVAAENGAEKQEAPGAASRPPPKVFPRNLTARADYQVPGNPTVTRLEDVVANCYPGLELDVRNLDRRFFPGLVFEFVARDDNSARYTEPRRYGAWLSYIDDLLDPDLQLDTEEAKRLSLALALKKGTLTAHGDWYLEWVEQKGKRLSMREHNPDGADLPLDGLYVWRLLRGLEPGPLTIALRRRAEDAGDEVVLHGWRRRFTDPVTGVINGAYQPGELLQSLCSPWQHDFRDCACTYWASNHPDAVFQEIMPGEKTLPDGQPTAPLPANLRVDWLRADRSRQGTAAAQNTIAKNRPYQLDHFQINRAWQSLSVVLNNTEIGAVYIPPRKDSAQPFATPEDLASELQNQLAPMEMALAIEYLYARFSVISPLEAEHSRWQTMKNDVTFIRHYLMLVAASEMQHLRWANELLWILWQEGLIKSYKPVLHPAKKVPDGKRGLRDTALRPLTRETLDHFTAVERPSGLLDGAYARVVATLRSPTYPRHAIELAERIDSDGILHYSRFREIESALRSYAKAEPPPYLRKIHVGTQREAQAALTCYAELREKLATAYQANAERRYAAGGAAVAAARTRMDKLLAIGEELAAKGIGIPFLLPS